MAVRQSVHMLVLLLLLQCISVSANWKYSNPARYPDVPDYGPQPNAPYMVDNTHNYYHVAPDKGKQNGPVWPYSGSFENYMANLDAGKVIRGGYRNNETWQNFANNFTHDHTPKRQETSLYWLPNLAPLGIQPLAPTGYKFFRNVVTDFQADDSGNTDASEAINAAVSNGSRCAEECGNDFTQGAIIYFPPGIYRICTPVIQLYYTQFIGDALNPPTIQGCSNFSGIALFDTDPYIPGGSGSEWYVNQNQFFRHIRNFVFDLTLMPIATDDNNQPLVPTGIHWQVAQATTLQNLVFNMPDATSSSNTTAVGIFTENGSGGFVSDLSFNGGNIGWRAGSQQFTARNLQFNGCLTAVQMVWDWGWTWQGIDITGGAIAFNISGVGGDTGQGIGSVSIIDSTINNVPVGILTNGLPTSPNIVLDNVVVNNVANAVQVAGGSTLLTASGTIDLWTTGRVYNGSVGSYVTGPATAPSKAPGLLLSNGSLFTQSRPQYESYSASEFSIATTNGGCKNDGTGDQTDCINAFLQSAVSSKLIAYFPAGIYQVGGTVFIPTGSRVQGSSWSQIQGAGYYFSDMVNPQVVVKVGNAGDIGTMEIVEMLFSVRGNTAGAILMEWNTAAVTQGAAAMWDSHFRVGGGNGTDLNVANCPKFSYNDQCIAATLMFHVTEQASGYFENIWAWVADHDNDEDMFDNFDPTANQITVFGARGMLIESQGPSWFYGTSSEHSVMYNYQVSGAKDIFMGHIQTETPYYQPNPIAPAPFNVSASFSNDPDFSSCDGDTACAATWGLRVVDSSSVTIHGAGLYSFFQDYYQDCQATYDCQERILEVTGSSGVVIFNLFTVATSDIAVGIDNTVVFQNASNQRGFTTEDSIWIPIPGEDNIDTVFVGTAVWTSTTVTCPASSCLLVFPTSSLTTSATISPGNYTTSFEYGDTSTVTTDGMVTVTFITTTTTTVLQIPPITIGGMSYSNYNITSGAATIIVSPSVDVPPITIGLPNGSGSTTSRIVPLPPWPEIEGGPTQSYTSISSGSTGTSSTYYTGLTSIVTVTGSTVTTITFPSTIPPTTITCPPDSSFVFATPSITVMTDCTTSTTWAVGFDCPTTKVVTFLTPTTGLVSVDCSLVTLWTVPQETSTTTTSTTTPLPVWTTWPPGIILPISTTVSAPQATNGGTNQPCKLWFFFICISWDDLNVGGWFWSFPPGIYPPGPPPSIDWPPGFTLEGTLPPWPEITIGPDNQLTYSSEPESSCETETASVCSFTTSYLITSNDGSVSTTATSTSSVVCETIYGCDVSYSATTVQTSSVAACTTASSAKVRRAGVGLTDIAKGDNMDYSFLRQRDDDCHQLGVVIYPNDPMNVGDIPQTLALDGVDYVSIGSTNLGYTAYFWVEDLPFGTADRLRADTASVAAFYYYYSYNEDNKPPGAPTFALESVDNAPAIVRNRDLYEDRSAPRHLSHNESRTDPGAADKTQPSKRAATSANSGPYWNDAVISLPPNQKFGSAGSQSYAAGGYQYFYDDSAGSGVPVYAIGETDVWENHPEFVNNMPRALPAQTDYGYTGADLPLPAHHGSTVAAMIVGAKLGVCKLCDAVYSSHPISGDEPENVRDWYLEDLLSAWDDMNEGGRSPATSVINISWGSQLNFWVPQFIISLYRILKIMDQAGVTIVVAAGNYAFSGRPAIDTYPQLFADPDNPLMDLWRDPNDSSDLGYLPNMIIVGAVDQYGNQARFSQTASFVTTYAAGRNIWTAVDPDSTDGYQVYSGTSYAAPEVAALAAYFKKLPSKWRIQMNTATSAGPAAVKAMIVAFQRMITPNANVAGTQVAQVWNGMVQDENCLLDYPNGGDPNGVCPDLPADITQYVPTNCDGAALIARGNNNVFERQAGSACSLAQGGGDGVTISVTNGPTAGPTCASSCGGFVCSGYWCSPSPTGYPPGYQDPKDPSSGGATASPTTVTQGFGGTTPSSSPPTTSPPTTSTPTTTVPPASTGLVVAAYTTCLGEADGECAWQWEIYTLPDATAYTFPGCTGNDALYTSVVSTTPEPTAIPTLGPFAIDGQKNCYFESNVGVSCIDSPSQVCNSCYALEDGVETGLCYSDGISCDEDDLAGYNADVFCYW